MPGTSIAIKSRIDYLVSGPNRTFQHASAPEIRFIEDDQNDPGGRFRIYVADNAFRIQRPATSAWAAMSDIFTVLAGDVPGYVQVGIGGLATTNNPTMEIFPNTHLEPTATAANLLVRGGSLSLESGSATLAQQLIDQITYNAAAPVTLTQASALRLVGAPVAGANVTISETLALHVDAGKSRFDGSIVVEGANVIQANSATEIGICVNNSALTVGSLGSLVVPVKTTTGAPVDAELGNVNGAMGFNSADNTLEVRDGADTYLSVAVAGYIMQRRAPPLAGPGWYHPRQRLPQGDRVDETRCVVCGDELAPGDQVTLWANGRVRDTDLHAIFGHLHLEENRDFQALAQVVASLEAQVAALSAGRPAGG